MGLKKMHTEIIGQNEHIDTIDDFSPVQIKIEESIKMTILGGGGAKHVIDECDFNIRINHKSLRIWVAGCLLPPLL